MNFRERIERLHREMLPPIEKDGTIYTPNGAYKK